MPEDLGRLTIIVDSRGVTRAKDELGRFVKIGGEAEQQTTKLSRVGSQLGQRFGVMARQLGVLLGGLTALVAIRTTINDIRQYETALVGVGKTTNIVGRDLQKLGRDFIALGTQTAVPTLQLLELGQAAGQMGVEGSANILKFARTIGLLATASDIEGESAAKSLARILNITGEAADEVDTLATVIVRLGNEFAASESEIVDITSRLAQSTAVFKFASAELAALGTAVRALDLNVEAAGTAIGRTFREIVKAIAGGGDQIQAFADVAGLSVQEFVRQFEADRLQGFLLFLEGLNRIGEEQGPTGVVRAMDAVGLSGERLALVIPTLATRTNVLADAFESMSSELKELSALETEAARAADTLDGSLVRARNKILAFTTSNEGLGAVIRDWVDLFGDAVLVLAGMEDQVQENRVAAENFAFALQAVGAALVIVGTIRTLVFVLGTLKLALVGLPFATVATAVGLLAVEFTGLRKAIQDSDESLKEILERLKEAAKAELGFAQLTQGPFGNRANIPPNDLESFFGLTQEEAGFYRNLGFQSRDDRINGLGISDLTTGPLAIRRQQQALGGVQGGASPWSPEAVERMRQGISDVRNALDDVAVASEEAWTPEVVEQMEEGINRVNIELEKTRGLTEGIEPTPDLFLQSAEAAAQFTGALEAGVNRAIRGFGSMRDIAKAFLLDLISIALRANIFNPLQQSLTQGFAGQGGGLAAFFGSLFGGGAAKGAAFNQHGMVSLAGGGAINRHSFGIAGNRLFELAEKNRTELVLPARRTAGGELGVVAAGGGASGPTFNQTFNITTMESRQGVRRAQRHIAMDARRGIERSR